MHPEADWRIWVLRIAFVIFLVIAFDWANNATIKFRRRVLASTSLLCATSSRISFGLFMPPFLLP